MKKIIKDAIEEYQCSGCVCGSDISCFEPSNDSECGRHVPGTTIIPIGKIFLGLGTGFNRIGPCNGMKIHIFETFSDGWSYDYFNIPVWKYLNEHGHTIIKGLSPRTNSPFLHIFLENCIDKMNCCYEITQKELDNMD